MHFFSWLLCHCSPSVPYLFLTGITMLLLSSPDGGWTSARLLLLWMQQIQYKQPGGVASKLFSKVLHAVNFPATWILVPFSLLWMKSWNNPHFPILIPRAKLCSFLHFICFILGLHPFGFVSSLVIFLIQHLASWDKSLFQRLLSYFFIIICVKVQYHLAYRRTKLACCYCPSLFWLWSQVW